MTTFTLVPGRSRVLTAKLLAAAVLAGLAAWRRRRGRLALATLLTPVFTDAAGSWAIGGDQVARSCWSR